MNGRPLDCHRNAHQWASGGRARGLREAPSGTMAHMLGRAFTDSQAARVTGLGLRRVRRWADLGVVPPTISQHASGGRRRVFDFRDLVSLKVVAELSHQVRWLQELRKAVEHLRGLNYEDPLAEISSGR